MNKCVPEPVYQKAEPEMDVPRASGVCALQAQTTWVLCRAKKLPLCHHQQLACDLPWGTQKIPNSPQQFFHYASSPLCETQDYFCLQRFSSGHHQNHCSSGSSEEYSQKNRWSWNTTTNCCYCSNLDSEGRTFFTLCLTVFSYIKREGAKWIKIVQPIICILHVSVCLWCLLEMRWSIIIAAIKNEVLGHCGKKIRAQNTKSFWNPA